jgi:AcrR family transcriptional regulator
MKQNYHHGNLKEALLQEALNLIENEGVEKITTRELSKRLGVSYSAIYRHFASKDDLIGAVIEAGFDKLDAKVGPIIDYEELDSIEKLNLMGKEYIQFALDNPNLYRTLFGNVFIQKREELCDLENEQCTSFEALVRVLSEGQEKGIFKESDPLIQASFVWSTVHGISNLLIDGHIMIQNNFEAIYNTLNEMLLSGLKKSS